jgi:hypothetical protein
MSPPKGFSSRMRLSGFAAVKLAVDLIEQESGKFEPERR